MNFGDVSGVTGGAAKRTNSIKDKSQNVVGIPRVE